MENNSSWESHPSLDASLQDFETPFEEPRHASQAFDFRQERYASASPQGKVLRSSAVSGDMASDDGSSDSTGPWSPPAWRRNPPSGWFQPHDRLMSLSAQPSPQRSRQTSPELGDIEGDTTLAPEAVPLPGSPTKGRSPSPSPEPVNANDHIDHKAVAGIDEPQSQNYFRFAVRAEVQHRTEPIEAAIRYVREAYERITRSRQNLFTFFTSILLAWFLYRTLIKPPESGPGPDLIKVAGLARSFEPLIHYSESGVQQVGDLQETGVAVWDLGESVRFSNMTSASIITKELDELSESLKTLAIELTRFFANVDGDVDSILIVMEWAKRELLQVSAHVPGPIGSAFENMSLLAHKFGGPSVGRFITDIFGASHAQMTKATLQRTFNEFLNVMEESINNELQYSTALFALFESIDRQFLNLQRTVVRETDSQEQEHDVELASLWRRLLGPNAVKLAKFEKNKKLLMSVKERTVANKLVLVDHNGKLLKLKSNLEILRKRLVSPLVRSNASSTLSIEEQIGGLDGTYELLRNAREKQKSKLMERLYGIGNRRSGGGLTTLGDEAGGRGS